MHRLFLGFSLSTLAVAILLTGCGQNAAPVVAQIKDEPVSPGESKPIPPGVSKPIPTTDPTAIPDPTDPVDPTDPAFPPPPEVKTDEDTLPVLPTLTAQTGQEKYEAVLSKAFLQMAEGKDKEALDNLQTALSIQETDFVKGEIERLQTKLTQKDAVQKTIDDIQEILTAGKPIEAAKLASEALDQYGETDAAETLSNLKRQADALVSAELEDKEKKSKYLEEAEAARKANNIRSAVLAYDQAAANGANLADYRDIYDPLKTKLQKYDENRNEAAQIRKDPYRLEEAITVLKVAQQNWDTPVVRQEIAESELAINNRKPRVAVADFEVINDIGVPRAGHAIAEELLGNFRPRFDVVERAQTNALLEELKLTHEALYEDETGRTEFGKLSRARYVVLGSVNRLAGISVNARLVDTQSGLIVQTARIVAASPEEMSNRLPALARMLQMNDDEKRNYEKALAEQARPVLPQPVAELPPPPPVPAPQVVAPPPPPIMVFTPRPPEFGRVVIEDFNGFRVIEVGAPPPPPVVILDGPAVVNQRAFVASVQLGDNCFLRGLFREALRHFEFALGLNPGHPGVRLRLDQCRPLCPPPVVVPVIRPRMVVLPFVEFRDPFAIQSSIPPGLGQWTADTISPYFRMQYDVVNPGEVYWWMGRLGLTLRDVLTNGYARLTLGRAVGARFFLMGSLREVASFDVNTFILDAELNVQVANTTVRCQDANDLRYRMGDIARLTTLPPQQQVVVVQQQQFVQQQVKEAHIQIGKGKFAIAIDLFRSVLKTNPNHVETRQLLVQVETQQRQADLEAQRQAAWQQQQVLAAQQRDRQIALAAAAEAQRLQAQRQQALLGAQQQKAFLGQQLLAQQNLIAQAQLANRQNNLEQRVSFLESANAIKRDDAVIQELADAKARLAVERQKRQAAEQAARDAEVRRLKDIELDRVKIQLVAEQEKKALLEVARQKAIAEKNQAEYDTFVDQGQRALAKQNYGIAVASFQNARRLKPSPEIEKLVSAALVEQARADAMKKGEEEHRKLEAQLAQEELRRKQLEEQNASLQVKYQAALAKAREAMKSRQYDEAVVSYKLASNTLRTEEANNGLREATDLLAKAKAEADVDAKKKAEEQRRIADIQKRLAEGRTAMAAKQYDKAVLTLKAATALKPDDVALQTELTKAQQLRDEAAALARRQKEETDKKTNLTKLLANGEANLKARQYDAAIVSFNEVLKISPDNQEAKAGLEAAETASAKMAGDAKAQAEAKAKRAAYEKQIQTGQAALRLKQLESALAAFQKAQEILPGDAASLQLIKEVTKQQDEAKASISAKQKAAELAQHLGTARTALRSSKFSEAQAAADKAAKISPDAPDVKKLFVDIDTAKKASAAIVQKKEMDAKKGLKVDALLADARKAIAAKDLNAASKFLAEAAVEDPTDPDIKKVQAEYEAVRRSMAAGDTEAKKKQEAYLLALRNASTAFATKKYPEAMAAAKQALALKPEDPAATKILNDSERMIETATAGAMEAKKRQEAYDNAIKTGRAALVKKDYDDAEKAFTDALKIIPNDPTATALLKQAKTLDAEAGAMEARKKQYVAAMTAAQRAMQMRDYPDAVEAYQAALKAIPADPAALKGLAEAKAAMVPPKKETPIVPKKIEPMPMPKVEPKVPPKVVPKVEPKADENAGKIVALFKAADGLEDQGKFVDAYKNYQEVLKLSPANAEAKKKSDLCAWMVQGQRDLAAGKFPEASVSFENALKLYPTDANAKKFLALSKAKKKA
ncbi:tetratricopeptide repeat protein [Zavarzinella formosa]|uniref:tetratricopeptide repeat protein n=1 Tax=Zavarzinella formosa TaxID=360055 RepID=UPI0002D6C439|nr:tetratricopeptide repeat protein [Zavarzinella formosa]